MTTATRFDPVAYKSTTRDQWDGAAATASAGTR